MKHLPGLLLLRLAIIPFLVHARVYESLERLPDRDYDFVIIGGTFALTFHHYFFLIRSGGTAGSVVAGRLTENHRVNVLLVEAGPK